MYIFNVYNEVGANTPTMKYRFILSVTSPQLYLLRLVIS